MTINNADGIEKAGLAILIVLQSSMLAALFTSTEPHPPTAVAMFAIAPFISSAPGQAIAAMQGINAAVRNPVFFATFALTPIVILATAAVALRGGFRRAAVSLALSALVYIGAVMLPTATVNVPMNEALAAIAHVREDQAMPAGEVWAAYAPSWNEWNYLRVAASGASLLLIGWASLSMALPRTAMAQRKDRARPAKSPSKDSASAESR